MQTGTVRQYSIVHPLFMSFFSKSLYRDVARNWRGLCFTYLLIVLTVNLIPDMVRLQDRVSEFLVEEAPAVVRQVPTISISEGTASIKEQVPYIIRAPGSQLPFAIIDTSDRPVPLTDLKATIMLTKTKLVVKGDTSEIHSMDLSPIHHLVIDQKLIYSWMETFKHYFIFVVYPFALFFAFLYYVVQVLICSSIGMFFAKKFGLELTASALVRLSVIAFTPPLLLQAAHSLLDIEFPYGPVISLVLAVCYLYYAVGSCSEKTVSRVA